MRNLSILIPTYNRSRFLERLLSHLYELLGANNEHVVVHVSDNSSTDNTSDIVNHFRSFWPDLLYSCQPTNIGPDANFLFCLSLVSTRWFWFIADDDLPIPGAIHNVLFLLSKYKPALVYLNSKWALDIYSTALSVPAEIKYSALNAVQFSTKIHAWFTFISAFIVDSHLVKELGGFDSISVHKGTNLIQLAWVLPLLHGNGPFIYVSTPSLLCTAGNTGDYKLLTVFGVNFPSLVFHLLSPRLDIANALIRSYLFRYLPLLIFSNRVKSDSCFYHERPWPNINLALGKYSSYWIFCFTLGRFPLFFAFPLYILLRLLIKFIPS